MERLQLENYEELAWNISDSFENLKDEYGDISIIAKYNEAKEIIKELLCIGYDIASIELHREDFENYCDEYIVSLNFDGVWCEKFKRDTGYFEDESNIMYIMDNCSSNVISYCKSDNLYEVSVCEDDEELSNTSNDSQNSESTYISRSKDGTPTGFCKSWVTVENGMTCYSSYSHYSDNVNMLKEVASDFGIEL